MHPPNRVPVDLAWLVVLRIAAGLGALFVPPLFWRWPHLFDGFLSSGIQIPYPLLHWIVPLPGFGMRLLLILCMIAGLAVILGFCYRVAALALFAILSYHFLLDSSYYQRFPLRITCWRSIPSGFLRPSAVAAADSFWRCFASSWQRSTSLPESPSSTQTGSQDTLCP